MSFATSTNGSSLCRSSSLDRNRFRPSSTSILTCAWLRSTWHLLRHLLQLLSPLRPPGRPPLQLHPRDIHRLRGAPAGGNNGRGRHRCGGRGQGSSAGSPQSTGGPPGGPRWPSFLIPWTGSIHMWPGSSSGRSHGPPPRPGQPPQQAMMAGPAAPGAYYPPAPAAFYQPGPRRPHLRGLHGILRRSPTRSAPSPSLHR